MKEQRWVWGSAKEHELTLEVLSCQGFPEKGADFMQTEYKDSNVPNRKVSIKKNQTQTCTFIWMWKFFCCLWNQIFTGGGGGEKEKKLFVSKMKSRQIFIATFKWLVLTWVDYPNTFPLALLSISLALRKNLWMSYKSQQATGGKKRALCKQCFIARTQRRSYSSLAHGEGKAKATGRWHKTWLTLNLHLRGVSVGAARVATLFAGCFPASCHILHILLTAFLHQSIGFCVDAEMGWTTGIRLHHGVLLNLG